MDNESNIDYKLLNSILESRIHRLSDLFRFFKEDIINLSDNNADIKEKLELLKITCPELFEIQNTKN
jgi:hypothetical protein